MIDLFALALFAYLLFRGWYRGFVREAMDLIGLVLGTLLAFRLAAPMGTVIEAMAGVSPDAARFVGGFIVFVGAGLGAAMLTRVIERKARLPGLNLMNRVGGAGLATAWGVCLATLVLSMGVILPMPPAVADQFDGSAVTRALTDPGGVPQSMFKRLSGDRIIEALINLRHLVGARKVVIQGDESITFPPAALDDLEVGPEAGRDVFDLLNRARVDAGLNPLAWSDALGQIGAAHAVDMYVGGWFSHISPVTGSIADRLALAGITYRLAGENLALAATPGEVHRGLMESPGHRANILEVDFRRVGVAVIEGSLGLMVVQVFSG